MAAGPRDASSRRFTRPPVIHGPDHTFGGRGDDRRTAVRRPRGRRKRRAPDPQRGRPHPELLPGIVEEHIQEAANRRRLAETEQTQAQALTERNTAEERLSQSQNRLRMILQQAPVLVWSTDKELRVTSAMGGGFRTLDTAR